MGVDKRSYTSAATMPVKLFHNDVVQNGKIVPYHVTMTPTNVCNARCAECFCDNRDKTAQLKYGEIKKITNELYDLGTRAISLSGGGEPDCHPAINQIINHIYRKGMDVAAVSNGKSLHRIEDKYLNMLKWVRISGTSSRPVDLERLAIDMKRGPEVDFGMSYVLGIENPPYKNLKEAIDFVNKNNLTHLRIVSDMMYPDENRLPNARKYIGETSDKIIWQERTENVPGSRKCLVNLLHPIVDANGDMQPCCGIMIATEPPTHDFGKKTAMCNWRDYREMVEEQIPFDGKDCKICQYDQYNQALEMLINKPEHEKFV